MKKKRTRRSPAARAGALERRIEKAEASVRERQIKSETMRNRAHEAASARANRSKAKKDGRLRADVRRRMMGAIARANRKHSARVAKIHRKTRRRIMRMREQLAKLRKA